MLKYITGTGWVCASTPVGVVTDDAPVPALASPEDGRRWKLPRWWMVGVAPLVATLAVALQELDPS